MHAALQPALPPLRQRLLTVFPMGRAKEDSEMILTDTEFRGLMTYIKQQRIDYREGRTSMHWYYGCEGFLGKYEGEVRDHFFDCEAGISAAKAAS